MSSPAFFTEGSTPRLRDTKWRIEQKILGALIDNGASGGSGSGGAQEVYDVSAAAPTPTNKPALRYPQSGGGTLEQWDVTGQNWV